ncbi:MAG TPA: glycoside hydrolase family 127 protein, partial [Chitinophagaceae bacterium]|nr:glycoside hydrolase family 127 protein [Chitinophagaceae bacterium]
MHISKAVLLSASLGVHAVSAQTPMEKFEFVNFSRVHITDRFWKPKMDLVATTTLRACIYQTETATPRIRNFEKVARKKGEKHEGIYYDDSDVYKALEAMSYSISTHHDSALERKADEWIGKIAAAQLPDGYLDTYFTLNGLDKRWTDVEKHEDYCAGHLIEAAVAYYDATGKTKLLQVAIRLANHIDSVFRLANKPWFSGHEEIELALVKLYRVTNDDRYLKLADWYLQQRGVHSQWGNSGYWQDALPVKEQKNITGHAVRAMYLYTGAADVGSLTGDAAYMNAMKSVWEDVVQRNMYLTGGIGSSGSNEGFTHDYDLPNQSAYCETCASVGMVFWNQRMAQLSGDGRYVDVLEKSLYNAALDGLSLSGDRFFYDNPLASTGQHSRSAWFGTACCPANIARLVASLGNYIYGKSEDGIWLNLFVNSNTRLAMGKDSVSIATETNYPWEGNVRLKIGPETPQKFSIHIRIPGWARGEASPGALYRFIQYKQKSIDFRVNGKKTETIMGNGYITINRVWEKGDQISFSFPMETLKIRAMDSLRNDADRIALQRGPLVYCIEGADNAGSVWNILV